MAKPAPHVSFKPGYVARDKDGSHWWFSVKPVVNQEAAVWELPDGRVDFSKLNASTVFELTLPPMPDWTKALWKV